MAEELGKLEAIFTGDDRTLQAAFTRTDTGFKNLRNTANSLLREITGAIPGVGGVMNAIARDFINVSGKSQKASEDVKTLNNTFQQFQSLLAGASTGKNKVAADLFKDFGINAEKGLRAPKEAFGQFINEFQRFPDAEGRARIAADLFNASAAKAIPVLEGTTVAMSAEAVAATAAAEATSGLGTALGVIGGIAVVAAGMFLLAKGAADAGEKIYEMGVKTGFAAETISALKLEGEATGVSFEKIGVALGFFDKNIESVHQSGKKATATFGSLRISVKDNETALRDAFKQLSKMPEGYEKTAAAAALFGQRSGKEMLTVIKETNGDLDKAIKKHHELGDLIGGESASNAHRFTEEMTQLWQEVREVGREIGEDLMPAVVGLAHLIESTLIPVLKLLKYPLEALGFIAELTSEIITKATGGSLPQMSTEEAAGQAVPGPGFRNENDKSPHLPGGSGGESGAQRAARQALQTLQLDTKKSEREAADALDDLKRKYDNFLTSLADNAQQQRSIENKRFEEEKTTFTKERDLLNSSAIVGNERVLKLREIQEREADSLSKHNKRLNDIDDEQRKKEKEAFEKHESVLLQLENTFDERELNDRKSWMEEGLSTREAYETRVDEILRDAYIRRIADIFRETQAAGNNQEKLQEINDKRLAAEEEFINAREEGLRRIAKARQDDLQDAQKWADTARNFQIDVQLLAVEIGRGRVSRDEQLGLRSPRNARREQDKLDAEEENQLYRSRTVAAIEAESERLLAITSMDKDANEKRKQIEKDFYEYSVLLGIQHADKLREIQERPLMEWRERMKQVATDIGGIFGDAVRNWDGTLKGFFRSIVQGLADMLKNIAAQILQNSVTKLLTNLFGSLLGGLFGGALSGGGGASHAPSGLTSISLGGALGGIGGHAAGGHATGWSWVGEKGPELAYFGNGGHVLSNPDSMKVAGTTNVYNTINVPVSRSSGYSQRKSRRQLGDELVRRLA